MNGEKPNIIVDKSFEFALDIVNLYKFFNDQKEFIISKQLIRSGTSVGANIEEAVAAESTKDFIHKLSIARKEARETRYWLRLIQKSDSFELDCNELITKIEEIINILVSIIKTTKSKLENNKSH